MPRRLLDDDNTPLHGNRERQRNDVEREPKSWRERDRMKDRSAHVPKDPRDTSRDTSPRGLFLENRERQASLSVAGALFDNPEKKVLEKKILSATSIEMDVLVNDYVKDFGYPESGELLAKFAEHSSLEVVKTSLGHLELLLGDLTQGEKELIVRSLKLVAMMGRDAGARRLVSGFLRRNKLTHV